VTGSGQNQSRYQILAGHALFETETGDVRLADLDHPAFAVAVVGAKQGGTVPWITDGILTLKNWTQIAGMPKLVAGQAYYVGLHGCLSKTGTQQIGIARNGTDLRVNIGSLQKTYSQLFQVTGLPDSTLGTDGDSAVDYVAGRYWTKVAGVWNGPWWLMPGEHLDGGGPQCS
jgi:hypothetical protein